MSCQEKNNKQTLVMEKYIEIGKRLKNLRGNLSQKEFAKKIGVSHIAYQNYEYGKRVPPGPVLSRIATICHVTTDYILTGKLDSLYERVVTGRAEVALQEKELEALNKELSKKLSEKGISIAKKDVSSFLNAVSFLKKYGIDVISLFTGEGEMYQEEGAASGEYGLTSQEKEYTDKLLEIFRTKDAETISAITQNIDTFIRVPDAVQKKSGKAENVR